MNNLKYKQYSSEEFAEDKDFWLWVLKENASQHTFWEQFIRDNPEKAKEIEQAREMVLQVNADKYKLEDRKVNTLWEKIQRSKGELNAAADTEAPAQHKKPTVLKH